MSLQPTDTSPTIPSFTSPPTTTSRHSLSLARLAHPMAVLLLYEKPTRLLVLTKTNSLSPSANLPSTSHPSPPAFHYPITCTADPLFDVDYKGEESWTADGSHIPVYLSANGECLRAARSKLFQHCSPPGLDPRSSVSSATRSIVEQISAPHLHWTRVVDFPETTTHAVNFGPPGWRGLVALVQLFFAVPNPLVRQWNSSHQHTVPPVPR